MSLRFPIGVVLALGLAGPSALAAQDADDPHAEDHDQLRALLVTLREAVNARDFRALEPHLYTPFSATMIDQTVLTTPDDLASYFEQLFLGDDPLIANLTMAPVADTLTEIYDDRFGIARGGNTEVYELTNGKAYTLESRWTATLIKDDGAWKLLAIHNGLNFVDNPVLAAAKRASTYTGGGGVAIGLLVGGLVGWSLRRGRRAAAA